MARRVMVVLPASLAVATGASVDTYQLRALLRRSKQAQHDAYYVEMVTVKYLVADESVS